MYFYKVSNSNLSAGTFSACLEIGRTSRGVSGALYLQSAIARANSLFEDWFCVIDRRSADIDGWVLRNMMPWTSSGGEPSSDKRKFVCAVRAPVRSLFLRHGYRISSRTRCTAFLFLNHQFFYEFNRKPGLPTLIYHGFQNSITMTWLKFSLSFPYHFAAFS